MIGAAVAASIGVGIGIYRKFGAGATRSGTHTERKITIGQPSIKLYDAWLNLLLRMMEPIADVAVSVDRIRWTLPAPLTQTFETLVEKTRPGEVLTWTNIDPQGAPFSGSVTFSNAPAQLGSEVALRLFSTLPSVAAGPALVLALRRFKSLVETGEVPSLEHNPSGRAAGAGDGEE